MYYLPGVGQFVVMTLGLSDTGRTNNIRRWGYFDEYNGLFFELSGSLLSTVTRNNGVDTKVPRNNWNGDKIDGSGLSAFTINVDKENLYWIDMAWLGVGEVRFGVLGPNGARIVVNTILNPSANIGPYMRTPHLPIRIENFNTGVTTGTSDLRLCAASVFSEGNSKAEYSFWRNSDVTTRGNMSGSGIPITERTPLFSIRNAVTNILGTGMNRVSIYPETLALFVSGGAVQLETMIYGTISGSSWVGSSNSTIEYDNQATSTDLGVDGYTFVSSYYGEGVHNIDLRPYYELNDEALVLRADGTQMPWTFMLTRLTGNNTYAKATLSYRELS
jgi:hypothetical protein